MDGTKEVHCFQVESFKMDSVGRQKSNPNDIQFDGDATFHAEIYVTNAWRLATTVMVRAAWHGIKARGACRTHTKRVLTKKTYFINCLAAVTL